ncbi:MAG: hypothetical protein Kow00104_05690 [Rhodothalassiaceae bacterium]
MRTLAKFRNILSRAGLARNRRGSVLVETAIVLPLLIVLLAGATELGFFMIGNQKINSIASGLANMVASAEEGLSESEINDIFAATKFMSGPFDVEARGRVIISAVRGGANGSNSIVWQRCTGNLTFASRVGNEGDSNVTLSAGIVLEEADVVIITEAAYDYRPRIFIGNFAQQTIYSLAMFRPRLGFLSSILDDGATPSSCA